MVLPKNAFLIPVPVLGGQKYRIEIRDKNVKFRGCFGGRCKLQIAGCRLQVAGCRLQVAGCRLQVAGAGCRLQVAGCRCRLQVAIIYIFSNRRCMIFIWYVST